MIGNRSVSSPDRNPFRVLYVDHCPELSGAEVGLLQLLRGFSHVEAIVLCDRWGDFARELDASGVRVDTVPLPASIRSYRRSRDDGRWSPWHLPALVLGVLGYVRGLVERIRTIEPDIVHTNSAKAHIYGGLAGRMAGVPVVCHLREPVTPDTLGRFECRLMRLVLRCIPSVIVANSPCTAESVKGLHREIRVVPSPIDIDRFTDMRPARRDSNEKSIGSVGTLVPLKGHDVFIAAFAEAFGSDAAVVANICGGNLFGGDDYEQRLRNLASDLGIADRVRFRGFVRDIHTVLPTFDLVVSASVRPEGFGQTIFQALAAGVPVIATNHGGPADFLIDRESALLVPPGDAAALARAMREAISNRVLRERLATCGPVVAHRFAPGVIQSLMLGVYEETRSSRSRHDPSGPAPVGRKPAVAERGRR
jgi:glycosyltransferase involved in cell wall biosynthesis